MNPEPHPTNGSGSRYNRHPLMRIQNSKYNWSVNTQHKNLNCTVTPFDHINNFVHFISYRQNWDALKNLLCFESGSGQKKDPEAFPSSKCFQFTFTAHPAGHGQTRLNKHQSSLTTDPTCRQYRQPSWDKTVNFRKQIFKFPRKYTKIISGTKLPCPQKFRT